MAAAKRRPPGTKLLEEADRIGMVEKLSAQRIELLQLLTRMPLKVETATLQRQKHDLERKLDEVEKALETFSRKIVYVKY